MKKKNGFIATSLIYSFFLVFITLFLTIIADYLQNKVLLNTIESDIKKDINETINIAYFKIGDQVFFQGDFSSLNCGNEIDDLASCSSLDNNLFSIDDLIANNQDKINILKLNKYILVEEENGNKKKVLSGDILYLEVGNNKLKVNPDAPANSGITITGVKS